ncbi:MAG: hypothetical protein F6K56_36345 [Moorea sp. SIO3G5]|nr:hypothetical protein [Moorena sp. SIO3G5]
MPVPPRCPFHKTLKIIPLLSNAIVIIISLFPIPDSRFPIPDFLAEVSYVFITDYLNMI